MAPIMAKFKASSEWQETTALAYPPPEKKTNPKKIKNRGTGFPGAAKPTTLGFVESGESALPVRTVETQTEQSQEAQKD